MKKIILLILLAMGGVAHAAQDSVSLYGVTEDFLIDRALLSIVGSVETSVSPSTKGDPSIIMNGRLRRLTVSDAGRAHVATMTPTGFYGPFFGLGSGIYGLTAAQIPYISTGVYTTGSYTDPAWLASIAASKIAAGSLGSSVMVSSVAIPAFYNNASIRSNLGLAIGSNVQAYDADLDDLADGSLTGSKVGSGVAAANIAAGSLGSSVMVSSVAVPAFYNSAAIRSSLGLAIGSNVQAYDADLDDMADGSLTGSKVGSGVPAVNIAAGSLGSSVIASSHAVASVQDSAIVGISGSKVSGSIPGNAATASALAADPADCTLPNVALGVTASGAAVCGQPSTITGNAPTASALAADPADCVLPNVALGVNAAGVAVCGQPSSITGNAATVTNGVYTTTAFLGDVTGTAGATIVGNDSHTHAPSSISGVVVTTGATMSGSLRNTVNLNVGNGTGEMYITPNSINQSGANQSMEVGTAGTGHIFLKTSALNRLHITAGGNVSIGGDTNPTAKLVVDGNVVSSGTVQAVSFHGSGAYLTNLPATGVTTSTETITLHSGGDVFVASGTFSANIGMTHPVTYSTITITGVRCYTLITSSVAATTFNIARSTDTGATATYSYLFNSPISVAANTKYSAWAVPDQNATYNPPYGLALHTIGVPASGALPNEYGCEIKYWRRLD